MTADNASDAPWGFINTSSVEAGTTLTEADLRLMICQIERHVLAYYDEPSGTRRYECLECKPQNDRGANE
jgi:hypothetical protein